MTWSMFARRPLCSGVWWQASRSYHLTFIANWLTNTLQNEPPCARLSNKLDFPPAHRRELITSSRTFLAYQGLPARIEQCTSLLEPVSFPCPEALSFMDPKVSHLFVSAMPKLMANLRNPVGGSPNSNVVNLPALGAKDIAILA